MGDQPNRPDNAQDQHDHEIPVTRVPQYVPPEHLDLVYTIATFDLPLGTACGSVYAGYMRAAQEMSTDVDDSTRGLALGMCDAISVVQDARQRRRRAPTTTSSPGPGDRVQRMHAVPRRGSVVCMVCELMARASGPHRNRAPAENSVNSSVGGVFGVPSEHFDLARDSYFRPDSRHHVWLCLCGIHARSAGDEHCCRRFPRRPRPWHVRCNLGCRDPQNRWSTALIFWRYTEKGWPMARPRRRFSTRLAALV